MISWKELVSCIEKLEELPNGGGSEIEFRYQGAEYGIVSYRGRATLVNAQFPPSMAVR